MKLRFVSRAKNETENSMAEICTRCKHEVDNLKAAYKQQISDCDCGHAIMASDGTCHLVWYVSNKHTRNEVLPSLLKKSKSDLHSLHLREVRCAALSERKHTRSHDAMPTSTREWQTADNRQALQAASESCHVVYTLDIHTMTLGSSTRRTQKRDYDWGHRSQAEAFKSSPSPVPRCATTECTNSIAVKSICSEHLIIDTTPWLSMPLPVSLRGTANLARLCFSNKIARAT